MTRSTPLEYAVGRAATTLHARPVDQPTAPWAEVHGVRDVRATFVDEAGSTTLADRFLGTVTAPLTPWQQTSFRIAMGHALLLARWVMTTR